MFSRKKRRTYKERFTKTIFLLHNRGWLKTKLVKKILLSVVSLFVTFFVAAQVGVTTDKVFKHNGEVLQVKVVKVGGYVIEFKYPGEDVEQTLGKLSVEKIEYCSGRVEKISDKVIINGSDDWEKVQIVTDGTIVIGLRKGEEIRGKTSSWINYNTQAGADKKATKHIKQSAAEQNVPYVLLTGDKNSSNYYGVSQGLKKGIMYTYN